MSIQVSAHASLMKRFRIHLKTEEYSPSVQRSYPMLTQHFLDYCDSHALAIEDVRPAHIERFLRRQYQLFRKRHRQSPPFKKWRLRYTGSIHLILRLVNG
jgi:hypothetical protein